MCERKQVSFTISRCRQRLVHPHTLILCFSIQQTPRPVFGPVVYERNEKNWEWDKARGDVRPFGFELSRWSEQKLKFYENSQNPRHPHREFRQCSDSNDKSEEFLSASVAWTWTEIFYGKNMTKIRRWIFSPRCSRPFDDRQHKKLNGIEHRTREKTLETRSRNLDPMNLHNFFCYSSARYKLTKVSRFGGEA